MNLSTPPSDAELLRLMSAGDEDAFTNIYRRRQAGVYRFALQMSGSEAVAEDVTQEVFMVLMRDADKFDPTRGSLAAYLYGIARNLVLRSFQKERPLVALSEEDEDEGGAHGELVAHHDPLGDLTRGETVARVRQAVLALPEHYREVVVLCELHEMSYVEAAEALECAVGTVRSRLHRGRALLVERLRHDGRTNAAPQALNTVRCFA
ncbi:MAG TPA: RNA polymerase sigma factor [Pyrinomonadaceae bacterium]